VLEAVVGNTFDALADYLRRGIEAHADPVARFRGACRAYVAFGHEHPEQVRHPVRPQNRTFEIDKTVDSMLGAEAFAFLLDAFRECAATGRSSSTQPIEDATAVWVALHGYVSLRAAIPDYPWPPDDIVLDNLIDRVALLSEESTGAEVMLRAGDRLAHHDYPAGSEVSVRGRGLSCWA
jgi:AcrR family transcriptional regulator